VACQYTSSPYEMLSPIPHDKDAVVPLPNVNWVQCAFMGDILYARADFLLDHPEGRHWAMTVNCDIQQIFSALQVFHIGFIFSVWTRLKMEAAVPRGPKCMDCSAPGPVASVTVSSSVQWLLGGWTEHVYCYFSEYFKTGSRQYNTITVHISMTSCTNSYRSVNQIWLCITTC